MVEICSLISSPVNVDSGDGDGRAVVSHGVSVVSGGGEVADKMQRS
jgi:hypothetical protein